MALIALLLAPGQAEVAILAQQDDGVIISYTAGGGIANDVQVQVNVTSITIVDSAEAIGITGSGSCVLQGNSNTAVCSGVTVASFSLGDQSDQLRVTVTNSAIIMIVNVGENAGPASITATRTSGSVGAVSATVSTSNGTAVGTSDLDFSHVSTAITFANEDNSAKTVLVPITNDTLIEPAETFGVTITAPTGGVTVGSSGTATVTIASDDVPTACAPARTSASSRRQEVARSRSRSAQSRSTARPTTRSIRFGSRSRPTRRSRRTASRTPVHSS